MKYPLGVVVAEKKKEKEMLKLDGLTITTTEVSRVISNLLGKNGRLVRGYTP